MGGELGEAVGDDERCLDGAAVVVVDGGGVEGVALGADDGERSGEAAAGEPGPGEFVGFDEGIDGCDLRRGVRVDRGVGAGRATVRSGAGATLARVSMRSSVRT